MNKTYIKPAIVMVLIQGEAVLDTHSEPTTTDADNDVTYEAKGNSFNEGDGLWDE